ncbi:MAG: FlgD immunoglobulin-like domain containing protein [Candidatus Eisenbacteria bacterium]|nr:FlgD immunoglobulin-like domain containing protein [Candidatus Eisenbacteria bacterium]
MPEAGGASAPTFAGRAYPNPFHSQVAIRFDMPQAGAARVLFFDAAGRRVASLAPRSLSAGPQSVLWSGRDDAGRTLGSGIYFFRVETGDAGATPLTGRVQKTE